MTQKDQTRSLMTQNSSPFSLIDRFFNDPFLDPFTLMSGLGNQRIGSFPKVDVTETDNEITVVANVPGISTEDMRIEVGDDYLSLAGRIDKENKDEKDGKVYRYEREYGEFNRSFVLPARVNKEGIVAKAKNGVLTITLPKSEQEQRTQVKIETED